MTTFKMDYAGVGELLRSDETEAAMVLFATPVMVHAEASAPVDVGGPHPGRYKESFHIESGKRHDRAFASVVNDSPESILVEYGSKNNPRHRTLGRALDEVHD